MFKTRNFMITAALYVIMGTYLPMISMYRPLTSQEAQTLVTMTLELPSTMDIDRLIFLLNKTMQNLHANVLTAQELLDLSSIKILVPQGVDFNKLTQQALHMSSHKPLVMNAQPSLDCSVLENQLKLVRGKKAKK